MANKAGRAGKRAVSVFLAAVMALSLCVTGLVSAAGEVYNATFSVQYQQTEARKAQSEINSFRTGDDTWYWNSDGIGKTDVLNLSALTYDYDLEKIAMQRAAELSLYYDHIRPDGSDFDTALSGYSYQAPAGECIYAAAGYYAKTASSVVETLKEEDKDFSGQADRRNMLSEEYSRIGCSCVYANGTYYWCILMASSSNASSSTTANDSTTSVTVPILSDRLYFSGTAVSNMALKIGESQTLPDLTMYVRPSYSAGSYDGIQVSVDGTGVAWASSDTSVVTISNGKVNAVGLPAGSASATATVAATINGTSVSFTVTVTETVDHVAKVDSTCTAQGHVEYWYIEETGQYFSDSGLTKEVQYADLLLPLADHDYQETDRTDAGCTANGSVTYKCSVCGDEYTETIQATGHNYMETIVPAECEKDGSVTYVCSRCQDSYSETIPATGHDWDDGVVTKEPTYTEDGEITYTCRNCGATRTAVIEHEEHTHDWSGEYQFYWDIEEDGSVNSVTCTFICAVCGEMQTKTGIYMGTKVELEPGCETTGILRYTVTAESPDGVYARSESRDMTIPATGHSYIITGHMDSTCKDNGYNEYTCENCGDTYREGLPLSSEHTWDSGVVITEPTATADGEMLYTCTVCGTTKIEAIPATGGDPEPSGTPEPSATESPSPSEDPEPSSTEEPSPSEDPEPSGTEEPEPSTTEEPSPSEDPEPSSTEEPSPSEDPEPSGTEEPEPSESPSPSPSDDPSPSAEPEPSVHEHEWTPVFAWSDDYDRCTVTFYCDSCDEVEGPFECTISVTGDKTVQASYTASYTFEGKTYTDTVDVQYSEPTLTFVWNDDYTACTLYIDNGTEIAVQCQVGWVTITEPTCTQAGQNGWCAWYGSYISEPVYYEDVPAAGHSWYADFHWTGDMECEVTFTCSVCMETAGPFDCTVISTSEGPTAYIEFDGQIWYSAADFFETIFEWNSTHTECNVTIISKSGAIVRYPCEVGWLTITEPTCTDEGLSGLFAWYDEYISDPVDYETIPATGHKWDNGVIIKEATATEDGEILYTCTVCGVTKTELIPATGGETHTHQWTPIFVWTDTGCTVTFHCDDCGETAGPFECEIDMVGYIAIASYEFDGHVYTDEKNMGPGEVTYTFTWFNDYTECLLSVNEADGAEWAEWCEVGWIVTKEPTCTDPGERGWCAWYGSYISEPAYTETIPAEGHQWSVSFNWSDDHEECEAVFTCSVCGETETVNCQVTYENGVYTAECEFDGQTWTATATGTQPGGSEHDRLAAQLEQLIKDIYALLSGNDYSDETADRLTDIIAQAEALLESGIATDEQLEAMIQTAEEAMEEAEPIGHVWQAVFNWIDEDSCEVTFICENCGKAEGPFECAVTIDGTTATAVYEFEGQIYSDTYIIETEPEHEHIYGQPEFIWSDDLTGCIAVFICEECGERIEVECAVTDNGDGTYTAEVEWDGEIYTDTAGQKKTAAGTVTENPDEPDDTEPVVSGSTAEEGSGADKNSTEITVLNGTEDGTTTASKTVSVEETGSGSEETDGAKTGDPAALFVFACILTAAVLCGAVLLPGRYRKKQEDQ